MAHDRNSDLARGRRLLAGGALAMAAGLLFGCPPAKQPPATMPAATRPDPGLSPVLGSEPVAGGVYLALSSYTPLSGDALKRALTDRAAIRTNTAAEPELSTQPASQPTTAPPPSAAATEPAEPPPLAVKYYLHGREKFLEGANSEAMDFLEKALALDPNAFTVLRLMGRVCFASSQLPRGSIYLQRAYAVRPSDVEVNYLLGRYWLERKDTDRAVSHLLQADDSPERSITSAQTPLVQFYLARALQEAGYHKAATAEYERFLETITLPVAGYRYDRELNYLIEESWAAHLDAAENDVLIGAYAKALPHYLAALAHQPKDAFVVSRLVNAQVHADKPDDARKTALALVEATQGADDPLKLLAWTYRATGHESTLLADLRARLPASAGDDPAPAITLAAMQDYLGKPDDAFATLATYLAHHPANLDVLPRLLKRVNSPTTFSRALDSAAAALHVVPDKQEEILRPFLRTTDFIADAKIPDNSSAESAYLQGIAWRAEEDPQNAERQFRRAVQLNPSWFAPRESLVSLLLSQDKFNEASALIQDAIAHNQGGAKAWQLQVESEGVQQRLASAIKVALEARQKYPDSPELKLQAAALYRIRGDATKADKELMALIDASPSFEPAYRSLINSLLTRSRDRRLPQNERLRARSDAQTYVGKLLQAHPDSVFGKINNTMLYATDGRFSEAESILRRVVVDHPDDAEVLIPLAEIRQVMGHAKEATATLEEPLKKHPTPELAAALADLYREQEKPEVALALTERLMKENPGKEGFAIVYASDLITQKKMPEAQAVLAPLVAKFPHSESIAISLARVQSDTGDPAAAVATMQGFLAGNSQTAARLYTLSHFQSAAGQEEATESTLERILAIMPEHAGANNDLAYFWTDAGKNLNRVEPMIKKALDNEPNNPAFLDSLGWLYYKQGRFDKAIELLQQSVSLPGGLEPEVVQHLADALYRNGQKTEAGERWRQALAMLRESTGPATPERQKVRAYVDAALRALQHGDAPTVTPIASEMPTTAPAATAPITGQAPASSPAPAPH